MQGRREDGILKGSTAWHSEADGKRLSRARLSAMVSSTAREQDDLLMVTIQLNTGMRGRDGERVRAGRQGGGQRGLTTEG